MRRFLPPSRPCFSCSALGRSLRFRCDHPIRTGATMRRHFVLAVAATLTGAVVPATAHHSFPVHFVPGKLVTVEGTVTEFSFRNPHGLLHFTVTDAAGASVE